MRRSFSEPILEAWANSVTEMDVVDRYPFMRGFMKLYGINDTFKLDTPVMRNRALRLIGLPRKSHPSDVIEMDLFMPSKKDFENMTAGNGGIAPFCFLHISNTRCRERRKYIDTMLGKGKSFIVP